MENINIQETNSENDIELGVEQQPWLILTDHQREICDFSTTEIILYYTVNPNRFFKNVYNLITTFTWNW